MWVDAIVNAANTGLRMGGGVCGAIFNAAGAQRLQKACDELTPVQTGGAVITPGFGLPAQYVIHAVGPIYGRQSKEQSAALLRSAYTQSLKLAERHHCESIAFPLISSGIYGYPKDEALEVARRAIEDYLQDHDMQIYLAVLDKSSFQIGTALRGDVASYIDQHYVDNHSLTGQHLPVADEAVCSPVPETYVPKTYAPKAAPLRKPTQAPGPGRKLDSLVEHLDEPFSATLLTLIDKKGKTDVEIYKKANLDRKLFSKIRTGKGYTPRKPTILALAVALELTLRETDDLLKRAGYALSHASKFDVIVEYFIVNRKYDIFEINEVLFAYDQPLLGA